MTGFGSVGSNLFDDMVQENAGMHVTQCSPVHCETFFVRLPLLLCRLLRAVRV